MQATQHPVTDTTVTSAQSATRRADGQPETPVDRRFFHLRESGYTGPIDQDGYAVPTVGPMVTPARTLRAAARYLTRHGWVQGSYYDQTATVFTPAACLVGAIGMVCYGGPVDAPALNHNASQWADFDAAVTYLDNYLIWHHAVDVYSFNDTDGRTARRVIEVLEAAAEEWDRNLAASYVPATAAVVAHADYPHEPGTLYDCPACEAACFCDDGFQCVHCAIEAESTKDTTGGAA